MLEPGYTTCSFFEPQHWLLSALYIHTVSSLKYVDASVIKRLLTFFALSRLYLAEPWVKLLPCILKLAVDCPTTFPKVGVSRE